MKQILLLFHKIREIECNNIDIFFLQKIREIECNKS